MNPNDDKNQMNQMAAQTALKQKEEEAYQKRLEEKRAARARVSAVGIDNPFDIPESYKDPRFHYMIVNDSPGRVNMFRARGYELVTDTNLAGYLNQKAGDPIKFATGNAKDPSGMLDDLINYINNNDYSAKDYGDRIFLVLDTDLDPKRIKEIESIRKECEENGIEIITSAPTFEIWFLMHFGDVKKFNCSRDVKKELKKYIADYKEGMDVYNKLGDVGNAIKEAKKQEKYTKNNNEELIEHNPHSSVYTIINNI